MDAPHKRNNGDAKRIMDDALKRALSTPHQPHKSSGKFKVSPKPKPRKRTAKKPGD